MTELAIKLLSEIKTSLYLLLITSLLVLIATLFMALRPKAVDSEMSRGWCGTCRQVPEPKSAEYARGKELFISNCASCHNKNMKDRLTGPALEDVESNWSKFPRKDLYNYIRHSQTMIRAKHPRALKLWKEHKPVIMNDFPSLADEDIESILYYIKFQKSIYLYR